MGLLDSVVGGLLGGGANNNSPLGNVLSSVLGGGQMGNIGAGGLGGGGAGPGLGGLVSQFEQAGLGHLVQSWIGGGQNQAVTPDQLKNVFGEGRVGNMASQAGMDQGDFLNQLAQHLPRAVDGMTPNGRMEDGGSVAV